MDREDCHDVRELQETVARQRAMIASLEEQLKAKDKAWAAEEARKAEELDRLREKISSMQFGELMKCSICKNACACAELERLQQELHEAQHLEFPLPTAANPFPRKRLAPSMPPPPRGGSCVADDARFPRDLMQQFKRLRVGEVKS